jgi:hypothetical protein
MAKMNVCPPQGHSVVARWTVVPDKPDAQQFRHVIAKGDLDDMSRPHAIAAFRNAGGGPFYACGDLPPPTHR